MSNAPPSASCRVFIRGFMSSGSQKVDTTVGGLVPLQWMKYCPECLNQDKSRSLRGRPNAHYTLWKRALGEARSLLDSSKMLEEDKTPNRRIFDICDLLYAFAKCSTDNIPKRKRDELLKTAIPSRLMAYFLEDPERFDELTIVQLGRLVWTMAALGQLNKAEPARVITELLRKEDRYKQLTGLNLVRVVQALKGVSETHPGRRHLGDRLMGQVLKQRMPLLKMELFVEGLRAAGQLTVINSVTQHKLVDLFLKEIIPQSGSTVMLAIPACLDSIKLTDDVVFEEWTTRFLSCLTESSSESILKDTKNEKAIGATLVSLAHLQVGPPGLTSGALGVLLDRMAAYIRQGDSHRGSGALSARALTTFVKAFGSLATGGLSNSSQDSLKSFSKKDLRENSTKISEVLALCLAALDLPNSPSDRLLHLAIAVDEINASDTPLLRGVGIAGNQINRLEAGFEKVEMESTYTIDELLELLRVAHSLGWKNDRMCKAILKVSEEDGIGPHVFARSLPYLKFVRPSEIEILQKAVELTKGRDAAQCLVQMVSMDALSSDLDECKRLLGTVLGNALSEVEVCKFTTQQLIAALMSGACTPSLSEQIFNSISERISTIGSSQIERISYDFHHHAMTHLSMKSRADMARRFRDFAGLADDEDSASQWRDAAFNIWRI